MSKAITMISPAKINLYLSVGDVRPDGYHDLISVFQALTLSDTVSLEPADRLELISDADLGIPAEENLAVRAARALGDLVEIEPAIQIRLTKRIPSGAGLGGGSSNAAAVIAALVVMWDLDPGDDRIQEAAASLGADVPFFLQGGTGLYRERGDVLSETLCTPDFDAVLVWPRVPVSTAAAYQAIDRDTERSPAPGVGPMLHALESGATLDVAKAMHNDFTPYSADMVEPIADALAWLEDAPDVLGVTMAGSGSAVLGICDSDATARQLATEAGSRDWWATATRASDRGVRPADEG